jgi:putative (di)nucleoside polyphosphate hydrolase
VTIHPRDDAAIMKQPGSALDRDGDAAFRAGVGIMLLNHRGDVLVGRRRDVLEEAWQMPQGGIRRGESPRQAALRELREEIGVDNVEIVAESQGWLRYALPREFAQKAWNGYWRGQRQKWFVMRFLGDDADICVDTAEPEFDKWKWVPVHELPHLVVSFKRQVYMDLLKEFPEASGQSLGELLIDPMIRLAMDADGVDEAELHALLHRIAARLARGDR